ncbi:MAG: DUF4349 domain-containing protein [Anaerolineae bacterium]|nr:DUF4349 domain-containing protein [Anaerolineae bacterium]
MMIKRGVMVATVLVVAGLLMGCGLASRAAPIGVGGGEVAVERMPELAPAAPVPMAEGETDVAWAMQDVVGDRMILRTANLSIVVKDTEEALEDIESLVTQLGGYISDLQTWRVDDQMAGTVTLRIPAVSFDQARERIKDLALEVEGENVSGQDVTEEYIDLEARLGNLEMAEEELRELLASAQETHKDAESILAIYREITNVRQQIEQIKGRMQYLEDAAALATLTISLTPEEVEEPVVEAGWEPLRQARDALRTLVNALKFLANVLIWVAVFFLPLAAILALPLVIVWLVWYLRRRRRRKAKAE